MQHQALAIASIMGWDKSKNFQEIKVKPHSFPRYFPTLSHMWPKLPLFKGESRASLDEIDIPNQYPQIIITCGRRMAGISIGLKERAKRQGILTKTIHVQDPRLNPNFFDILLVPKHDRIRGDNVIVTTAALNRLNKAQIHEASTKLPESWKLVTQTRIAVLIGGDNKRYKISKKMAEKMVKKLANFAKINNATLFLVPSKRCPDWVEQALENQLSQKKCRVLRALEQNPYPGVLEIADAIIVTSDSINMASEAAYTGKPVLIAPWTEESGRIAKFHDNMQIAGHTATLDGLLSEKKCVQLNEKAWIKEKVTSLLQR